MRRTILVVCAGLALVAMLAPAATADEPIPVTCSTVSIQNGWGTGNDKEVNAFWLADENDPTQPGTWLWHNGTGYFLAPGDTYCRGRWYLDGWWKVEDPSFPEGVTGYLWGDVRIELSHGPLRGSGFSDLHYEGEFTWNEVEHKVWEGTASGVGYGELAGWQIELDVYLPYYPPVGCWGPGCPQHIVWTGEVTPG